MNTFIFAAGGIDKVNTLLENISVALYGIGVVSVTIGLMICGYQMVIMKKSWQEIIPVFIGSIIIGSASAIAGYLLG